MGKNNPATKAVYDKRYYREHREVFMRRAAAWRKANPSRAKFHDLATDAKERGRSLTLTYKEFSEFEGKPCFYCGGTRSARGGGLDRVDNSKGYEIGNVRPCCKRCNVAKGDMPQEVFRELIKRIYVNWAGNASSKDTD